MRMSSYDEESLAKIKMGVNVDIKRSDGKNKQEIIRDGKWSLYFWE